jgi:transcriptional regulator with XRE-family HTH domain
MTASPVKLATARLTTWLNAARQGRTIRPAHDLYADKTLGVIGGAVVTGLRRSTGLSRRALGRRLGLSRTEIRRWESGTTPLYCVPYICLARLAETVAQPGTGPGVLDDLLLAAQCDHLIASLLHGEEDFADIPPIDQDTAEGDAARALLQWAIRGHAPARFQHLAASSPLLAAPAARRLASTAGELADRSVDPDITAYGRALLLLIVPQAESDGSSSQHPGKESDMAADDETRAQQDEFMAQIAQTAGGTLHIYPRPGHAVRSIILRDLRDDRGTHFEVAQIEDDGTLRIIGHDTGPAVTDFFGEGITSYEWIYTIAPGKVGDLLNTLNGTDVLAALASYYQQTGGQLSSLLKSRDIAADFENWQS